MGLWPIFLIAVSSLSLVSGNPDAPPPTPTPESTSTTPANSSTTDPATLPPHQLAFDDCDWIADCNHMSGKIPIPCGIDYCDRFLMCIDNQPTMQQCDPLTTWLFWKVKTNFNPLSLQCEKDFKTCDWYLTVRLSSGDELAAKASSNSSIGYDTTGIEAAADDARDEMLNEIKKQASEVIQRVTNSTKDMIEQLKLKLKKMSEDVQNDTMAVLQDLKDNEAKNSTQVAHLVMQFIVDQIHITAGEVKDGIGSVVETMKEKISGVLSSFQENAAKEVERERESLHKILPKPEQMDEVEEDILKDSVKVDVEKKEADKPAQPMEEEKVVKQEQKVEAVNITTPMTDEGMMQGDEPPKDVAKGNDNKGDEKVAEAKEEDKEAKEKMENKMTGSAAAFSQNFIVVAGALFVVFYFL